MRPVPYFVGKAPHTLHGAFLYPRDTAFPRAAWQPCAPRRFTAPTQQGAHPAHFPPHRLQHTPSLSDTPFRASCMPAQKSILSLRITPGSSGRGMVYTSARCIDPRTPKRILRTMVTPSSRCPPSSIPHGTARHRRSTQLHPAVTRRSDTRRPSSASPRMAQCRTMHGRARRSVRHRQVRYKY